MKTVWRDGALYIQALPLDAMGRLAACAPGTPAETEVLAALLAGARVCMGREALEYRRYRRTAPREIYARLVGLERRLRELGIGRTRLR